jgi:hypothetical protein
LYQTISFLATVPILDITKDVVEGRAHPIELGDLKKKSA